MEWTRVLAGLPLPAMVVERDRILAANPAAQALLGSAMEGRHPAMAVRAPSVLEAIAAAAGAGGTHEARMVLRREGQEQVLTATASGQGAGCALVVFRDVTEEEKVGEMRRDFVANVSHELRTPLTALMGFIETLRNAAKDDPRAREMFLGVMEAEAGRMNRLVGDLLQLSRVEAEERVRPKDPVELRGVLEGVISSLAGVAAKKGDRVELVGDPVTVPGDRDQLVQVFTNLIENALKYGRSESGSKPVEISLAREGSSAVFSVRDHGPGVAQAHIPRLTERFYRVDAGKSRAKGGTGLGLAIVKHIVLRHRGRLAIESQLGEGSLFRVTLPAIEASAAKTR